MTPWEYMFSPHAGQHTYEAWQELWAWIRSKWLFRRCRAILRVDDQTVIIRYRSKLRTVFAVRTKS